MKLYTYGKCSTCQKAVRWLRSRGLSFTELPIREQPPSKAELKRMLSYCQGNVKRLFNTSGADYREQKLGESLPSMSEAEVIERLAGNGNLVKRPFLLTEEGGLVGFQEAEWESFFK